MVSTRYLGGKRMSDYAYAMTMLQNLHDEAGAATANAQPSQKLMAVFGDAMRAGQRFYGLKSQVAAGKARALIATDFSKAVSVDGGDYAEAPVAVSLASGTGARKVQVKGAEKPVVVTASPKAKLLFVQDGFAAFGKVALGAAPGAIMVTAYLPNYIVQGNYTIKASLDGGDEVELPHLFENVSAGSHALVISNVYTGASAYLGLQDEVTVESGKRTVYDRTLEIGKGKLRITDIPQGSTLTIDGDEMRIDK